MEGQAPKEYQNKRKGFWIETDEKGQKFYCHKAWRDGKKYIVRKPLSEFMELLKKAD